GWQLPALRPGERYFAVFLDSHNVTQFIHGDRLTPSLHHSITPSSPSCRLFISGPTYMGVKRASLGAEGYVIDHYHREAALRYLETVVAPMLRSAPPDSPIRTIFCDSLEVYNANWTHDFPAQFRKRRGYDLVPHLPELFDSAAPAAQDLRFDF